MPKQSPWLRGYFPPLQGGGARRSARRRHGCPTARSKTDEILRLEYEQNVKDAQELANMARTFEEDLEKDDRFVLSLSSLKKLDDMERLTKRIRSRMKHLVLTCPVPLVVLLPAHL